ncbi:MAG: peptidylprolyl isomerase [Calditrichia bacterium]
MRKSLFFWIVLLGFVFAQKQDTIIIRTSMGDMTAVLYGDVAPKHASNFKKLIKKGFFNGCQFHRVVKNFVIQGGDPKSKDMNFKDDGTGGPGYTIPAEIKLPHVKGAIGAARESDKINPTRRSSGSQFYICLTDLPHLDNKYTVFGQLIEGWAVLDSIAGVKVGERDHPVEPVWIEKIIVK